MEQKEMEKLKDFQKRWKEKCEEIKNNPMPQKECRVFRNLFQIEVQKLEFLTPDYKKDDDFYDITNSIRMDVDHAIIISLSKWKDKHPGFWENLSKNLKVTLLGR